MGDLSEFDQEAFAQYMLERTPKAEMIYEYDTPSIELECLDNPIRDYCIPTSRFAKPGTEPFAWGPQGFLVLRWWL